MIRLERLFDLFSDVLFDFYGNKVLEIIEFFDCFFLFFLILYRFVN